MNQILDVDAVNYKHLLSSFPTPYLILSADAPAFTIVAVSDAYLFVTQTFREQVVGRKLFDVFPDNPKDKGTTSVSDLHTSLVQVIQKGIDDEMGIQRYDIPHEHNRDEFIEKYWSVTNSPVFENGTVKYIVHRAEDVTEFF